jgi:hypothetical protein
MCEKLPAYWRGLLITCNTKITHLGDVFRHTSCLQLRQSRAYPDQNRRHGCEESEQNNFYDANSPPAELATRLQALKGCAGSTCRTAEDGGT